MSFWDCLLLILQYFKPKHQKKPSPATQLKATLHMTTATLTWTLPTTRTDVPPTPLSLSEIASVSIFDVSTANPSETQIASVVGPVTTFTTDTLTVGFHNFTVKVVDTTGHVSADSNVASVEVKATLADPSPATNLVAMLN